MKLALSMVLVHQSHAVGGTKSLGPCLVLKKFFKKHRIEYLDTCMEY